MNTERLIIGEMATLISNVGYDSAVQGVIHSAYDTVSAEDTLEDLRQINKTYGKAEALMNIKVLMERYGIRKEDLP